MGKFQNKIWQIIAFLLAAAVCGILFLGILPQKAQASEQDGVWIARSASQIKEDQSNLKPGEFYPVKWGDTLSRFAEANGTSVAELTRLNGGGNPNVLPTSIDLYRSETEVAVADLPLEARAVIMQQAANSMTKTETIAKAIAAAKQAGSSKEAIVLATKAAFGASISKMDELKINSKSARAVVSAHKEQIVKKTQATVQGVDKKLAKSSLSSEQQRQVIGEIAGRTSANLAAKVVQQAQAGKTVDVPKIITKKQQKDLVTAVSSAAKSAAPEAVVQEIAKVSEPLIQKAAGTEITQQEQGILKQVPPATMERVIETLVQSAGGRSLNPFEVAPTVTTSEQSATAALESPVIQSPAASGEISTPQVAVTETPATETPATESSAQEPVAATLEALEQNLQATFTEPLTVKEILEDSQILKKKDLTEYENIDAYKYAKKDFAKKSKQLSALDQELESMVETVSNEVRNDFVKNKYNPAVAEYNVAVQNVQDSFAKLARKFSPVASEKILTEAQLAEYEDEDANFKAYKEQLSSLVAASELVATEKEKLTRLGDSEKKNYQEYNEAVAQYDELKPNFERAFKRISKEFKKLKAEKALAAVQLEKYVANENLDKYQEKLAQLTAVASEIEAEKSGAAPKKTKYNALVKNYNSLKKEVRAAFKLIERKFEEIDPGNALDDLQLKKYVENDNLKLYREKLAQLKSVSEEISATVLEDSDKTKYNGLVEKYYSLKAEVEAAFKLIERKLNDSNPILDYDQNKYVPDDHLKAYKAELLLLGSKIKQAVAEKEKQDNHVRAKNKNYADYNKLADDCAQIRKNIKLLSSTLTKIFEKIKIDSKKVLKSASFDKYVADQNLANYREKLAALKAVETEIESLGKTQDSELVNKYDALKTEVEAAFAELKKKNTGETVVTFTNKDNWKRAQIKLYRNFPAFSKLKTRKADQEGIENLTDGEIIKIPIDEKLLADNGKVLVVISNPDVVDEARSEIAEYDYDNLVMGDVKSGKKLDLSNEFDGEKNTVIEFSDEAYWDSLSYTVTDSHEKIVQSKDSYYLASGATNLIKIPNKNLTMGEQLQIKFRESDASGSREVETSVKVGTKTVLSNKNNSTIVKLKNPDKWKKMRVSVGDDPLNPIFEKTLDNLTDTEEIGVAIPEAALGTQKSAKIIFDELEQLNPGKIEGEVVGSKDKTFTNKSQNTIIMFDNLEGWESADYTVTDPATKKELIPATPVDMLSGKVQKIVIPSTATADFAAMSGKTVRIKFVDRKSKEKLKVDVKVGETISFSNNLVLNTVVNFENKNNWENIEYIVTNSSTEKILTSGYLYQVAANATKRIDILGELLTSADKPSQKEWKDFLGKQVRVKFVNLETDEEVTGTVKTGGETTLSSKDAKSPTVAAADPEGVATIKFKNEDNWKNVFVRLKNGKFSKEISLKNGEKIEIKIPNNLISKRSDEEIGISFQELHTADRAGEIDKTIKTGEVKTVSNKFDGSKYTRVNFENEDDWAGMRYTFLNEDGSVIHRGTFKNLKAGEHRKISLPFGYDAGFWKEEKLLDANLDSVTVKFEERTKNGLELPSAAKEDKIQVNVGRQTDYSNQRASKVITPSVVSKKKTPDGQTVIYFDNQGGWDGLSYDVVDEDSGETLLEKKSVNYIKPNSGIKKIILPAMKEVEEVKVNFYEHLPLLGRQTKDSAKISSVVKTGFETTVNNASDKTILDICNNANWEKMRVKVTYVPDDGEKIVLKNISTEAFTTRLSFSDADIRYKGHVRSVAGKIHVEITNESPKVTVATADSANKLEFDLNPGDRKAVKTGDEKAPIVEPKVKLAEADPKLTNVNYDLLEPESVEPFEAALAKFKDKQEKVDKLKNDPSMSRKNKNVYLSQYNSAAESYNQELIELERAFEKLEYRDTTFKLVDEAGWDTGMITGINVYYKKNSDPSEKVYLLDDTLKIAEIFLYYKGDSEDGEGRQTSEFAIPFSDIKNKSTKNSDIQDGKLYVEFYTPDKKERTKTKTVLLGSEVVVNNKSDLSIPLPTATDVGKYLTSEQQLGVYQKTTVDNYETVLADFKAKQEALEKLKTAAEISEMDNFEREQYLAEKYNPVMQARNQAADVLKQAFKNLKYKDTTIELTDEANWSNAHIKVYYEKASVPGEKVYIFDKSVEKRDGNGKIKVLKKQGNSAILKALIKGSKIAELNDVKGGKLYVKSYNSENSQKTKTKTVPIGDELKINNKPATDIDAYIIENDQKLAIYQEQTVSSYKAVLAEFRNDQKDADALKNAFKKLEYKDTTVELTNNAGWDSAYIKVYYKKASDSSKKVYIFDKSAKGRGKSKDMDEEANQETFKAVIEGSKLKENDVLDGKLYVKTYSIEHLIDTDFENKTKTMPIEIGNTLRIDSDGNASTVLSTHDNDIDGYIVRDLSKYEPSDTYEKALQAYDDKLKKLEKAEQTFDTLEEKAARKDYIVKTYNPAVRDFNKAVEKLKVAFNALVKKDNALVKKDDALVKKDDALVKKDDEDDSEDDDD